MRRHGKYLPNGRKGIGKGERNWRQPRFWTLKKVDNEDVKCEYKRFGGIFKEEKNKGDDTKREN